MHSGIVKTLTRIQTTSIAKFKSIY